MVSKVSKIEKTVEVVREELKSRPTRDEVRQMMREELHPIREDLNFVKGDVASLKRDYPTRDEVKQMIHDGVDIIRVLIENYRSDFRSAVDGYKGLDGRVGSLEHRVDTLEKQV